MKRCSRVLIAIFIFYFVLQPFTFRKVNAAEAEKNIIILLDNSGSMIKTDPYRLSIVAASMLIDTLDENTNLNIIAFGDKADYDYKLLDKPSRESLKTKLNSLAFNNSRTDLKEGMSAALSQLENVQGEKIIVVLSDGKEDPAGGLSEEHIKELFSLGDKAHEMRVKVHCIGLSQLADEDTLTKISSKTGGDYFYSENPSELFNVFNKILGNLNGFYTIEQFTTDASTDKEIKLSSYIDEVILKIASCDNTEPLVDVDFDEGVNPDYKSGDKYKIYKFSNDKDSTIRITSKDKESNSVIVQAKSKVQLNINSSSDNLAIPIMVPMDIQVSMQSEEAIKGLHMDKLEDGIRERINSDNNEFKFTFKKEKPGKYPVFITAYDGNSNIVAVKEINITVKDYPPFYYTEALPSTIITENSFRVEVKQQDDSEVDNPSGEVYVEYGDKYEKYPFKFEDGMLAADITLKRAGDIKISSRIDVIKENKSYSYYLPYFNSKVIEKPFVELVSESYSKPFKQDEPIALKLNIDGNTIWQNEKFFVYSTNNENIGEFELSQGKAGSIEVPIKALGKGENFEFFIKPEHEKTVKVTDRITTNIRVVSNGSYFLQEHKVILTLLLAITVLASAAAGAGVATYKLFVEVYKSNKEFSYTVAPNGIMHSESICLSKDTPTYYMNLVNNKISIDEFENNAIGSFELKAYSGPSIIQGLRYLFERFILRRNEIFKVWYRPIVSHFDINGDQISDIEYMEGERLKAKMYQKEIKINFQ